ncbi:hypothetical protein LDBPK_292990 [Leishmania donovani]|nr:hypothetical protein LDBPK_292990 [Leishmania donovani]CBZ36023.1 hypothetical protein LDBPK_292990 [Leishmania donovani]
MRENACLLFSTYVSLSMPFSSKKESIARFLLRLLKPLSPYPCAFSRVVNTCSCCTVCPRCP